MPRSPRVPPRPPIDRATVEAALAGDEHARHRLVYVIGGVIRRVLAQQPLREDEREQVLLGVWRDLSDDDFAVLRQWHPESCSFEQHVAAAVLARLGATASMASGRTAWTPVLVGLALDDQGQLQERLARDVIDILRRCASQTFHEHGRDGKHVSPDDVSQDFAARLFAKQGAILRQWDPERGRKTLRSYLSFIGGRHFRLMLRRGGRVVDLHDDLPEIPAPQPQVAALLHYALMLEAAVAQLEDDEHKLLELLRLGVSAEEGAAALGIAANTFNQRKHRLLRKLRAFMEKLEGDGEG